MKTIAHLLDHLASDHNMRKDRQFTGQPHTLTGHRGQVMIEGLSFRDLRDCYLRAYIKAHPTMAYPNVKIEPNYTLSKECDKGQSATICENDLLTLKGVPTPMAILIMLSFEIEKAMGIYPKTNKDKL